LLLLTGGWARANALDAAVEQLGAGDYRAALATLGGWRDAETAGSLFLRATALAGDGQLDEAAPLFERLIELQPQQPEAYNNLAVLRMRQGRLDEAKELLERALHTDERYARIQDNLSLIYVEMARNSYAKALRMETEAAPPPLTLLAQLEGERSVETVHASHPPPDESDESAPAIVLADQAHEEHPPELAELLPESSAIDDRAAVDAAEEPESEPEPEPEPTLAPEIVVESPPADAEPVAAVDETPSPAPESRQQAIENMLKAWAKAWARQDTDAYLAYYDAAYAPEGTTRKAWESERRSRIARPDWIKIQLEDIKVSLPGPDVAVVTLRQRYSAPRYTDMTLKRIGVMLQGDAWVIISEANLKVSR